MRTEERKEIKEVVNTVYIAEDGTEFTSEINCKRYEITQEKSFFWCRVSIEPIELDFSVNNNEIFLLKYCKGYTDWLYRGIDGIKNIDGETDRPSILKYCRSNKQARKFAARNKNWKRVARLWVKPEEEERISTLGYGENYLSIEKVEIA